MTKTVVVANRTMIGNKEKILKNTYSITVPNDKSEDITITISDEDFRNMHAEQREEILSIMRQSLGLSKPSAS